MEVLDLYLNEVGVLVPRHDRDDIVTELRANLVAEIEDEAAKLGRPIDEPEVEAILKRHGHPRLVAAQFRHDERNLTFGRALIGREIFPLYVRFLRICLGITLSLYAASAVVLLVRGRPAIQVVGRFLSVFLPIAIQLAVVTIVFIAWDYWNRRRRVRWTAPKTEPRVQPRKIAIWTLAGWAILATWWALIPAYPALLLGSAARGLQLSTSWSAFHLPVLLVLLAGVVQRAVTLIRPQWIWVGPAARWVINGLGLIVLYWISRSYPLFVAYPGNPDHLHYEQLGRMLNANSLLSWLWIYIAINFAGYTVFWARQLRRKPEAASTHSIRTTRMS